MCMLIVRVSSTGHEQLLRFFSSCQHHASGEAGRCAWIHARNSLRSSGPSRRKARGNARRRSARSRHARTGCTCAPRPGLLALSSGTTRRGGSSTYATTRRRSDFGARSRHPTQVRTGGACLIWQLVYRFHPCLVAKRLGARVAKRLKVMVTLRLTWQPLPGQAPRRIECRCATPSSSRRAGRFGLPSRLRATAGSRAR